MYYTFFSSRILPTQSRRNPKRPLNEYFIQENILEIYFTHHNEFSHPFRALKMKHSVHDSQPNICILGTFYFAHLRDSHLMLSLFPFPEISKAGSDPTGTSFVVQTYESETSPPANLVFFLFFFFFAFRITIFPTEFVHSSIVSRLTK